MVIINEEVTRLALSIGLGAAVGIEREFNEKPAGLKTNVLICLGSTLFTLMSNQAFQNATLRDYHIAAQIIAGVGFLGAGAIMKDGDRVTGLTTAAVIWVVAAIGMAVGMGEYAVAEAATGGTLAVQLGFGRMDSLMDHLRQRHTFKIVSQQDDKVIAYINDVFRTYKVNVVDHKVMKKDRLYHSEWKTAGSSVKQDQAAYDLLRSDQIIEVTY